MTPASNLFSARKPRSVVDRLRTAAAGARLPSLAGDERGTIAIIFALCVFVFMLAIGVSIDFARAYHADGKISAAIDSAAIAAAKSMRAQDGQDIAVVAERFFNQNMKGSGGNYARITSLETRSDPSNNTVVVTAKGNIPTVFARAAGIDKIAVARSGRAAYGTRDIEVGMALDVTGSMNDPSSDGTKKIVALKSAFAKFAAQVIPATPTAGQRSRIALAPYSASINLGGYAATVSGGRSADKCVTERIGGANTDKTPTAGGLFYVAADGKTDIDGTEGKQSYVCPTAKVVPLSDDRTMLINAVNSYTPNGATGGHFGAQWAWNLVSEDWGGVWGGAGQPDTYGKVQSGKLVKAVILMTDGIFNTAYHNASSATQALALCQNMKDRGVLVFSIAFNAPAVAKATLQSCASTGPDYFADAADSADLEAALQRFAVKLGELRLTQ